MQHFRYIHTLQEDFQKLGLIPNGEKNKSALVSGLEEDIGSHNELAKSIMPPMQFPTRTVEDVVVEYRNAVDAFNKKQFTSEAEENEALKSIEAIEDTAKELAGYKANQFQTIKKECKSRKANLTESYQKGQRVEMLTGGLKGTITRLMPEPDGGVRYEITLDNNGGTRMVRVGMFTTEESKSSKANLNEEVDVEKIKQLARARTQDRPESFAALAREAIRVAHAEELEPHDAISRAVENLTSDDEPEDEGPTRYDYDESKAIKAIRNLRVEGKKAKYKAKKSRKKYVMSSIGAIAKISESLKKSLGLLSEEKLSKNEMISALESIQTVAGSVCSKSAKLMESSTLEEKKLIRKLASKGAKDPKKIASWMKKKKGMKESFSGYIVKKGDKFWTGSAWGNESEAQRFMDRVKAKEMADKHGANYEHAELDENKNWWINADIEEALKLQHVILGEETPEEKKLGYDLGYVGDEWDELDDWEDEGDDIETIMDLTHVGDEWDALKDDDKEGKEVKDQNKDEKDYVGAQESIMVDLRCMGEDCAKLVKSLKEGKVTASKVQPVLREMTRYVMSSASKLVKLAEAEFKYVGQDDTLDQMNGKPESPKANKYVGQDEPDEDNDKPEAPLAGSKYVGQDGEPNAQKEKPTSPATGSKYVGQDDNLNDDSKPLPTPKKNKYVGQDDTLDDDSEKLQDKADKKYVGQDDPSKTSTSETPVQKKGSGEVAVIEDTQVDDDEDEDESDVDTDNDEYIDAVDGLHDTFHIGDLRRIASFWHEGQFSALYKFASSGMVTAGLAAEAERAAKIADGMDADQNNLEDDEDPVYQAAALRTIASLESRRSGVKTEDELETPITAEPTAPAIDAPVVDAPAATEPPLPEPRDKRAIIREMEFVLREASKIADPKPGYGLFDPEAVIGKGKEELYGRFKTQWDKLVSELHDDSGN